MPYDRKDGYKKYVPLCPLTQRQCYKETCSWYVEKADACSVYMVSLHLYGLNRREVKKNGMDDNADSGRDNDVSFHRRKSQSK